MADQKISQLNALTGANVTDADDVLVIVDTSATETKKITREELFKNVTSFSTTGAISVGTTLSVTGDTTVTDFGATGEVEVQGGITGRSTIIATGGQILVNRSSDDTAAYLSMRANTSRTSALRIYSNVGLSYYSSLGTDGNDDYWIGNASWTSQNFRGDWTFNTNLIVNDNLNTETLGVGTTGTPPGVAFEVLGGGGTQMRLGSSAASAAGGLEFYGGNGERKTAEFNSVYGTASLEIFADPADEQSSSYILLSVDGIDRMKINDSGNVLVGSDVDDGYKMFINGNLKIGDEGSSGTGTLLVQGQRPGNANAFGTLVFKNNHYAAVYSPNISTHRSAGAGDGSGRFLFTVVGGTGGDTPYVYEMNHTEFSSNSDNIHSLGTASTRWSVLYAATGTINTSDKNLKTDIRHLTEAEKRVGLAAKDLIRVYLWKGSILEKGSGARKHVGIMAQDLVSAFSNEGLDAWEYGVVCRDRWYEEEDEKVFLKEGESAPEGYETFERLGVRYEQLYGFILGSL